MRKIYSNFPVTFLLTILMLFDFCRYAKYICIKKFKCYDLMTPRTRGLYECL